MGAVYPINFDTSPPQDPEALIELAFIEAYLAYRGYHTGDLAYLPAEKARVLRIQASIYASGKLAEIETRSKLLNDLHR